MNQFRRGYNRIALLTGLALVFIAVGIEYFQYQRNCDFILTDLKNRLDEHTSNVNLRARNIQGYVNGLKTSAENSLFYIKHFGITSPLYSFIKDIPQEGLYSLNVQDSPVDKSMVGNLTGIGPHSPSLKAELNMALMLNTLFEVALKNNRGTVWAYYTSKHNFQNLYPWLPSCQFSYFKALQDKLFFKGATVKENPKKLNFWTIAYQDGVSRGSLYQKGYVVTNSSPIYDEDTFLGSVSIDLSLTELNRVMRHFEPSKGQLFLINKEHQILASNQPSSSIVVPPQVLPLEKAIEENLIQTIDQEIKEPTGWFVFDSGSILYVIDLHQAPWFIVYLGSTTDLFYAALMNALEDITIILLILAFVVGMVYLIVTRDFISPAQKLVDHISKENRGAESSPTNIPTRWKPWFTIVSRIFSENRTLLHDLENRVKTRTKQLQQKNTQLEKTLSDLKKAQKQIIVQEKLASLGALTAGIAHEIKNPLNFIINFSDLSLEYLQELREKEPQDESLILQIEENIQKAHEHAQRADSIVKSMLSHARGSTGKVEVFNVNTLLNETLDLAYIGIQSTASDFHVIVRKDQDLHLPDIEGSKQDLARVFFNIMNNAYYAMAEKKKEKGDSYKPTLHIQTKSEGNTLKIVIEDNGTGIKKAVLKKIFIPFYTTKEAGKGTGLGLSLSYDIIVHQHHGHLSVESEVGRYTRFLIDLPKREDKLLHNP